MEWYWRVAGPIDIQKLKRRAAHVADVGSMQVWRSQQGFSILLKEEGNRTLMSSVEFLTVLEAVREANTRL